MTTAIAPRRLVVELPEFCVIGRNRVQSLPSRNVIDNWRFRRLVYVRRITQLRRFYAGFLLVAGWHRWGVPADRVRVVIVRRCGRLYDDDNLQAAPKPFIDLLKKKIVVDDSPRHLELVPVEQRQVPAGERGVTIEIEEVL